MENITLIELLKITAVSVTILWILVHFKGIKRALLLEKKKPAKGTDMFEMVSSPCGEMTRIKRNDVYDRLKYTSAPYSKEIFRAALKEVESEHDE